MQTDTGNTSGIESVDTDSSSHASSSYLPTSTVVETGEQTGVGLPPLQRPRKRAFNWNMLMGLLLMLGVSVASWTGLTLLIPRLLK